MSIKKINPKLAGVNQTVAYYLSVIDIKNVEAIAHRLQIERGASEVKNVAANWVEAVIIELVKRDLVMKFKGD